MVAPIIAAGARVAAGAAGRRGGATAARTAGARGIGERRDVRRFAQRELVSASEERGKAKVETKRRVSLALAGLMVSVAVLIDAAQALVTLIPLLGQVISAYLGIVAAALFGIWFLLLRVNYFSGRKAGLKIIAALGGTVVELIPIVDALPVTTVAVITIIMASWAEDRGSGAFRQAQVLARFARARYARPA